MRSVFVEYDYYPQSGSEQMGGWIRELVINPEEHSISTLILPVKTSWNKEELMSLCKSAYFCGLHEEDFVKWAQENLEI